MERYFNISKLNIEEITRLVHEYVPAATEDEVEQFIDSDWPNADEHQEWIDAGNSQEIGQWVGSVLSNTHPSMICED